MRQDRLKLKIIALVAFAIGILFFNSQKLGLEARKGREVNLDSNVDDVLNSDELAQLSDLSSSSSSNTESLSNTGINAAVSNSTKYKKYFTDCKHVMRFKASCQINIKSILEKHTNVEYYKYLEDFVEFAVANEEFQLKDNLFIESISDSSEISDESELEYGFSNSESFEEVDMTDDSYTVSSDNSNENSLSSDTSSTFNNSMSTSSSSYSADSASLSGGFEGASMGAESSYEQGKSSSYGTTIAGSQNNIVSSSEANANANSYSTNKIKNKEKSQSTSKSKNQKNVNRQSAAKATAKARTVNNVLHNQFKKSASVARKHVTTTSSKEMELTKYNEDYLQYYINLRTYLEIDGLIFETNTETYFYSSKTNDEKDALMKECERELEYRFDMQPDNYMVDTGYQDFCLPTIFEDEEEEIAVVDKIKGMQEDTENLDNQIATLNQEIVQLKPALDKAQIKLDLLGMGWFNIQNSTSQDKFFWLSDKALWFEDALEYCENLNDLEIFQENKDYFSDRVKMHEPRDPDEFS